MAHVPLQSCSGFVGRNVSSSYFTGDKCFGLVDTCKRQLCGNATVGIKAEVLSAVIPAISGLVPMVYSYVQHYHPVFFRYTAYTQI
jgi:hypothetical protein